MKRHDLNVVDTTWWKCDRYEIKRGMIRPAKGAKVVKYQPWLHYRQASENPKTRGNKPHEELANLFRHCFRGELRERGSFPYKNLAPDTNERILEWCNRWGLLGTLPHYCIGLKLYPVYGHVPQWSREESLVGANQTYYARRAGGWAQEGIALDRDVAPVVPSGSVAEGSPYPQRRLSPTIKATATLIGNYFRPHQEWGFSPSFQQTPRDVPLSEMWAQYFPSIPSRNRYKYQYPSPASAAFWSIYAEPVGEFLRHAEHIDNALVRLADSEGWLQEIEKFKFPIRGWELQPLLEGTVPSVVFLDNGTIRYHWAAPTLLGAMGMMVLSDIAESQTVVECANPKCRKVVTGKAWQLEYCSETCSRTTRTRRYRERKRVAKRMRKGGASLRKIANELDERDLTKIKRWLGEG